MTYKCERCKDKGVITYVSAHADCYERVFMPCPHCDAGKRIDKSSVPQNHFFGDNNFLSWEERHDPVTMRPDSF